MSDRFPFIPGSQEAIVQANVRLRNELAQAESRARMAENELRVVQDRFRGVEAECNVLGQLLLQALGHPEGLEFTPRPPDGGGGIY